MSPARRSPAPEPAAKEPTKKEKILSLYLGGLEDVGDIALLTGSRPSYVAGVLQQAGLRADYHDVFTSTARPMNVYSKFFAGRLGFKDEATARAGVAWIDRLYHQFLLARDYAGQHHALLMALTMFNRARWTKKEREAEVYRAWLVERLGEMSFPGAGPAPVSRTRGAE